MSGYEFCELWWSGGYRPQLTFYRPFGAESVVVHEETEETETDPWISLEGILSDLRQHGWELVSAGHHSGALFFKRHLL